MAQKMQFLAEDVDNAHEPSTAELKTWFANHGDRFALPGGITFRHLYFSPDQRGHGAYEDAVNVLAKFAAQPENSKVAAGLADRFMFQDYYADRSPEQLAKDLGTKFAQAVFKLKTGSWQGPVESGYGWHLVFVDSFTPGRIPAFEEVQPEVKAAWLADEREHAWQKAYEGMRAKYTVALPRTTEKQHASASVPDFLSPKARRAKDRNELRQEILTLAPGRLRRRGAAAGHCRMCARSSSGVSRDQRDCPRPV